MQFILSKPNPCIAGMLQSGYKTVEHEKARPDGQKQGEEI